MLRHEGDPARCAVLLPGIRYFSQAPLLWFAREAVQADGWSVLEVDERFPGDGDPFGWMLERAREALEDAAGADTVLVIGKSLGSIAATFVNGPAVWLTPLLDRAEIVAALERVSAPTLLVGSPADPSWNDGAVPHNPALEVLELPGLDHSLQVRGDVSASFDALRSVTQTLSSFCARFADSP